MSSIVISQRKRRNRHRSINSSISKTVATTISILSLVGHSSNNESILLVSASNKSDGDVVNTAVPNLRGNSAAYSNNNDIANEQENDSSAEPKSPLNTQEVERQLQRPHQYNNIGNSISTAIKNQHRHRQPPPPAAQRIPPNNNNYRPPLNPHPNSIPPGLTQPELPPDAIPLDSDMVAELMSSNQIVNSHELLDDSDNGFSWGSYNNNGKDLPQSQGFDKSQAVSSSQQKHKDNSSSTCKSRECCKSKYATASIELDNCLKQVMKYNIGSLINGNVRPNDSVKPQMQPMSGMKPLYGPRPEQPIYDPLSPHSQGKPPIGDPIFSDPNMPNGPKPGLVDGPNGPGVIVNAPDMMMKPPPMMKEEEGSSWVSSWGSEPPPPPPMGWNDEPWIKKPIQSWDRPPPPSNWGSKPPPPQWQGPPPPTHWEVKPQSKSGKSSKELPSLGHSSSEWSNVVNPYYSGKSEKKVESVWNAWDHPPPPPGWEKGGWEEKEWNSWGWTKSSKWAKSKSKGAKHGYWWDESRPPSYDNDDSSPEDEESYNYCGISYADANSKCTTSCPSGMDSECPDNESCFADATGCPPTTMSEVEMMIQTMKKKKVWWGGSSSKKEKPIRCGSGGWWGEAGDDEEETDDMPTTQDDESEKDGWYRRSLQRMQQLYSAPPPKIPIPQPPTEMGPPPPNMNMGPPPNMMGPPPMNMRPLPMNMGLPPHPPPRPPLIEEEEYVSGSGKSGKSGSYSEDYIPDHPPPNWPSGPWDHPPPPEWHPSWDSPPPPGWNPWVAKSYKANKSSKKSWYGEWPMMPEWKSDWKPKPPEEWKGSPPEQQHNKTTWKGPDSNYWEPPWWYSKGGKAKAPKWSKSKSSKSSGWGWGGHWTGSSSRSSGDWYYDPCMPTSAPQPPTASIEPIPQPPTSSPTTSSPIFFVPLTNQPTTSSPVGLAFPTYSPTNPFPTYSPTSGETKPPTPLPVVYVPPTYQPTYNPTEGGTSEAPQDLLVWGSSLSTSMESMYNILVPFDTEMDGISVSAGSKYSLFVDPTGKAYSTGKFCLSFYAPRIRLRYP